MAQMVEHPPGGSPRAFAAACAEPEINGLLGGGMTVRESVMGDEGLLYNVTASR